MLEQVGLLPKKAVAANLAVFIQSLQPSVFQELTVLFIRYSIRHSN